jgi:lipopolysaccharide export system permease protein
MSTISSYILRQTLGPLLGAVAIALLVLLTERMLRLLDLVLDTGGGLKVLLQLLAFLVPHYMALALPVAIFLGVLLAFGRLHQNNELDALGSAGVGLRRLVRPVLLLALALTAIAAANFAVGQPYARYIYRALVHDVAEAAGNVYLQERTFMEVDGVTFMAERIWRRSQQFAGIFIYEEKPGGKTTALTARRGSLDVAPPGEPSTLFLQDGVRLESRARPPQQSGAGADAETGTDTDTATATDTATDTGSVADTGPGSDSRPGALKFSQLQAPINLVGQNAFRARGEDERELTLTELWRYRLSPPEDVTTAQMLAEFHDRIVRTLSVLFLPFLAVPFALGPRRLRQAYGTAGGLLILVAYNQVLAIGQSLASIDRLPSLAGQWLPFVVFAVLSLWLFHRAAYRVPRGVSLWSPLEALRGLLGGLRSGQTLRRPHLE